MVKKFTIPFASQGDANDIPDALQVDGKVSFTQGFGYDYERPYDDPQAKDIAREDMNGLFKAITSAVGELQTLGASEWSSAISYPKGAIVYYEKDLYISQVDDNQNTPPQNWVSITSIANDSLKKAANLSDLTNKTTARNNLGLGSSATLNKTDVLGTSTSLVATQKLVNDTKINLENSINAIENTSKTFLVKSNNLSDLTNKTTARSNLGLGSSATLNKTDTLGTSSSLVATQKLVNDTKINLENSKQDKLTFVGEGPEVMKTGAYGVGGYNDIVNGNPEDLFEQVGFQVVRLIGVSENAPQGTLDHSHIMNIYTSSTSNASQLMIRQENIFIRKMKGDWVRILTEANNQQIGVGQDYYDLYDQRSGNVTYTNSTKKPIFVEIMWSKPKEGGEIPDFIIDGKALMMEKKMSVDGLVATFSAIIAPGVSYRLDIKEPAVIYGWRELR